MSFTVWPTYWPDDARDAVAGWIAKYGEARDALEAVTAWENYDVEYADEATQREHDADYAHANAVLAKHPRPYLDTGGRWVS